MITRDEALAELKARGVDPANPPQNVSPGGVSREEALSELQARGIDPGSPQQTPSISQKVANVAQGGLETLAAPFQVVGEAIRGAGEGEPLRMATAQNQAGFRAPSILQRFMPSLQTQQPPADPFTKSYQGLEGLAQLVAGKGAQQASDAVTGQPDTPATLGGLALALGTGDTGNLPFKAATKPLGAIADKLMPNFESLTAPVRQELRPGIQEAEKYGYKPLPSGLTGSKTQAKIENYLSAMPFSGDVMAGRFKTNLDAINQMRAPIIKNAKPIEDIGAALQGDLIKSSEFRYQDAQNQFTNAMNALPDPTAKLSLTNLQQKAAQLLKAETDLPAGSQATKALQLLRSLSGESNVEDAISQMVPKGATPEQIKNARALLERQYPGQASATALEMDYPSYQRLRTRLNDLMKSADVGLQSGNKFQSSPEAGIFKQLQKAGDQDLTQFSENQGGQFKQALDQARTNYGGYKQLYKDNKYVQSLLKEQNPSAVVNKAIKLDNPQALEALKQNVSGPVFNDLQDTFIKNLTEKNPDEFSPTHLVSQYEKIGESKLTNFLGPEKAAALKSLYQASKATVTAEKIAGNPSGTGQSVGSIIGLSAPMMLLLKMKFAAAGALAGAEMEGLPAMARNYLSEPGVKFLSRQSKLALPNVANAVAPLARTGAPVATQQAQTNIKDLIGQLKNKWAKRSVMK